MQKISKNCRLKAVNFIFNPTLNVFSLSGNLVAVYTPRRNITACEITSKGHYIVLAHEDYQDLVTLQLRGPSIQDSDSGEIYGTAEHNYKVFELKESDVC